MESTTTHGMELRHVVLDFKRRRPERKSGASYQAEYRSRIKSKPQRWEEYKERQKVHMKTYLNNLSEEERRARQEKKTQRQREVRREKKQAQQKEQPPLSEQPVKKKSRKSLEDSRAYWRERKRLQRASMRQEEREAVNQREQERRKRKRLATASQTEPCKPSIPEKEKKGPQDVCVNDAAKTTLCSYDGERAPLDCVQRKRSKDGNGPLSGQVAVVTGASSGIGKATAIALAAAGAKVALAARRDDVLQEVVKSIHSDGGEALAVKADVTDREQMRTLVQSAESSLGPVDILVNSAGVMYYTLMKNLHQDEWDRQIEVNCKGVTNGIGAVLDGMLKRGKGHIVNISSDAGRRGFAGLAVYSGTKFFVEGVSQALRHEMASTGVKVTCIQPGDVKTPLLTMSTDEEANQLYNGSEQTQILEPTDVARAIVYAVCQPPYVAVNEILVEPREAPI